MVQSFSFSQTVTNLLFKAVLTIDVFFFKKQTKTASLFHRSGCKPRNYMDTQVWKMNRELKTHSTVEQSLRAMALTATQFTECLTFSNTQYAGGRGAPSC